MRRECARDPSEHRDLSVVNTGRPRAMPPASVFHHGGHRKKIFSDALKAHQTEKVYTNPFSELVRFPCAAGNFVEKKLKRRTRFTFKKVYQKILIRAEDIRFSGAKKTKISNKTRKRYTGKQTRSSDKKMETCNHRLSGAPRLP